MNNLYLYILFLKLTTIFSSLPFPREDNIIVLTSETIDEALKTIPRLFIEFYAPWCPHCISLAKDYSAASKHQTIKDLDVAFAKINIDFYKEVAKSFGIQGMPTLVYFQNGKMNTTFFGPRTPNDIAKWFTKLLISANEQVTSIDDIIQNYENSSNISFIYFGNNNDDLKHYNSFAFKDINHKFGFCSDKSIMDKYNIKERTLVLYKPFDNRKEFLNGTQITKEGINKLLQDNIYPLVNKNANDAIRLSFLQGKTGLFVIRNKNMTNITQFDNAISNIAKKFKGDFYVYLLDIDKISKQIEKIIEVNKQNDYLIFIREYKKGFNNWKFEKEFSEENVTLFINDWKNGLYVPPIKSEEIPIKQEGPIYKLVNKSFEAEVIDNNIDVLVKFYSPYCGHCKKMAPAYEELGKIMLPFKDKIRIAEFNMIENDFDLVEIEGYPTVILWREDNKSNPIFYNGNRKTEDFIKFLHINAKNKFSIAPKQEKNDL